MFKCMRLLNLVEKVRHIVSYKYTSTFTKLGITSFSYTFWSKYYKHMTWGSKVPPEVAERAADQKANTAQVFIYFSPLIS